MQVILSNREESPMSRDSFSPRIFFTFLTFFLFTFFLGACGDLEKLAQNNLYPTSSANKTAVPENPPAGYGQERLSVSQDGKQKVHFWYYQNTGQDSLPVVIYFHGNGENLGTLAKGGFLKALEGLESHLVVMDYPGYGKSTGTPSEPTVMAAAQLVLQWSQKRFPRSPIIVWGWSLGAAVASQVTFQNPQIVDRFVLASPWTRVRSLAKLHFGSMADDLSEEWYLKNEWNSVEAAKGIRKPGLIFHGTKDDLIPFEFGKEVHANHDATAVEFVPIPGKEHNNLFQDPQLWVKVKEFIHR